MFTPAPSASSSNVNVRYARLGRSTRNASFAEPPNPPQRSLDQPTERRDDTAQCSLNCDHRCLNGVDTLRDSTSVDLADLTVRADRKVYLFEFKMVDDAPTGQALAQIRAKG